MFFQDFSIQIVDKNYHKKVLQGMLYVYTHCISYDTFDKLPR